MDHLALNAAERLRTVAHAAAAIQLAPDEEAIFAAIGAAIQAVGLNMHVETLDPACRVLTVRAAAVKDTPAEWLDRILGRPLRGIELPIDRIPVYQTVVDERRVVTVASGRDWLASALPWLPPARWRALSRLPAVGQGVCAPLIDGDNRVLGTLSVWGPTVTEADSPTVEILGLHAGVALANRRRRDAELDLARLDGAVKTARLIAHEINNELALILGSVDLIGATPDLPPDCRDYLSILDQGVDRLTASVHKLSQIVRFAETPESGSVPPMLDLDRSTEEGRVKSEE